MLFLFGENLGRWKPGFELNIRENVHCIEPHAGKENGHAARSFFTKKMLQPFDADNVRVAHALKSQHNEFNVLRFNSTLQRVKISIELGRGAEEQFSLEIVDEESGIDGCV